GRVRFGLDPDPHPFQQLFAQASVRPGVHGSLSMTVEREHGSTLFTPWQQDWLSAQVHADLQLGGTRVRIGANARRYDGTPQRVYGVIDAEWDQNLLFGHRLTARARVMSFGGMLPEESLVQIGYTIPLAVPVGPSRHSARVAGRIVDATSGRPISNALVRLGDRAQLTDRSGRFIFSGLAPDTYYIHVDRHGLAGGQIVAGEDPLPVRVGTLETRHIELGLVRGAQLTGAVRISTIAARRIAGAPMDELADSAAMPNVLVSLTTDGGTTLRRITDEQGLFVFSDLRPGRWTLRIPDEALPAHFRLQHDSIVFDITPGDTVHAGLRVVPEHRTLHIIATADLTATGGHGRSFTSGDERSMLVERPTIQHSYTVTRWDVGLMQIARYMYGDASLWPKIWVANRFQLSDPNTIRPGQTLLVPDKAPLTLEEIAARDVYRHRDAAVRHGVGIAWPQPAAWHSYTVTRWDIGLMQIARYMYGDASLWPKIWVANRAQLPDPDMIHPGQTLIVPDKAPLTPEEIAARDAYLARRRR
ncbi:MAG TPA: carboxypeptidase regulatory-like domain-containing protein, partial [Gemmatimonadaceae bacterium]